MGTTKNFTNHIVKVGTNIRIHEIIYQNYLIIAAMVIMVFGLLALTAIGAYVLLPAQMHYHIKKTFVISQVSGDDIVYLGIILPKSGPYQTVNNLSIQWDGVQDHDSRAYVDLIKLSHHLSGDSEIAAVVEYDITLSQGRVTWYAPVEATDLLPEEGIESDHELIKQTALQIISNQNGNQAYKIFKFTTNFLQYSETECDETNASALEAFSTRLGACIGYSRVMVALSRAAGIPARMVIGTILPDILFSLPEINETGIPGSGHAWVEYNDQDKWHLADPSCGRGFISFLSFDRSDGQHLSFGDFERFAAAKEELYAWATRNAIAEDNQLTTIFASGSGQTDIRSESTIRKIWDLRWANVILALIAVAFTLSKISGRIIRSYPLN
jgi:hypothetical protein